jgi:hypothetical protein
MPNPIGFVIVCIYRAAPVAGELPDGSVSDPVMNGELSGTQVFPVK